ncbi:MAG: SMP-30/gluconolactonase/LRE family protein, partial [Rhodospirillales bacterium]|nr:SMP-30/gluconolactonase/LRE family protein [Rhodospirillales bacterium]
TRLNDGKVGPDGAFWVGSIDERSPRQPIGALYRVTADGRVEKRADGIANSNGLAWSPDERVMYHSDTAAGVIEAWDFDVATGDMRNHRVLARLGNEDGRPDGAAMDADGNYWSAGPSAGCINCFSPSGELLAKIPFPVPGPTMPCFADEQMYVTSLREGKSAEVLAAHPGLGGLFRAPAPATGAPVGVFAD